MNALGALRALYDDDIAVDAAVVTSECKSISKVVANSIASGNTHNSNDDDEHKPQDRFRANSRSKLWRSGRGFGPTVQVRCNSRQR